MLRLGRMVDPGASTRVTGRHDSLPIWGNLASNGRDPHLLGALGLVL
jgi:hypothetical protein